MNTTTIQLPRASARARSRSTRWKLTRVEGRRLVTHPIFVLGLAATTAQTLAMPRTMPSTSLIAASDISAVCILLVTFLAASRDRRDHAQDTYLAQPVTPVVRSQAALLSLAYAGLTGATLAAALAISGRLPDATITTAGLTVPRPLALGYFALYYVMAGAIGVLLGSWTKSTAAALLATLVLFVAPLTVWASGTFGLSGPGDLLGLVLNRPGGEPSLLSPAGMTLLAAAGALARHDRRPHVVLLAVAGLGVIAGPLTLAPATVLALIILLWPRTADPAHTTTPSNHTHTITTPDNGARSATATIDDGPRPNDHTARSPRHEAGRVSRRP